MKKLTKTERKRAAELGVSPGELRLIELLEEVNERLRWAQMLSYATQYILTWKEVASQEEMETVLRAVARSVEREGSQQARTEEIAKLKSELLERGAEIREGVKILAKEDRKRRRKKS